MKHRRQQIHDGIKDGFRARKGAAPLKLCGVLALLARGLGFRARKGAAPLKPLRLAADLAPDKVSAPARARPH